MMKMKIVVTTPKQQVLTYLVNSYEFEGGMIFFYSDKHLRKAFPVDWCELTEVNE